MCCDSYSILCTNKTKNKKQTKTKKQIATRVIPKISRKTRKNGGYKTIEYFL